MLPLYVLAVTFVVFRLAGAAGVSSLRDWRLSLRLALAAMFLLTASAHWGSKRDDLVAMVPPSFPAAELLVTFTGLCEIAGAVGLVIPRTSRLAAAFLAVLLVVMFPANVYAAQQGLSIGGRPVTPLPQRTAAQIAFIAATAAVAMRRAETKTDAASPATASDFS